MHDFFDLVVNEQSARIIELLFHHLVVIMGFIVTLVSCFMCNLLIFSLLRLVTLTISSPFKLFFSGYEEVSRCCDFWSSNGT